MAQDTLKIDPRINEEIDRQKAERYAVANEEIDRQKSLREGDYSLTTIPGIAQGAIGTIENVWQMIEGFAAAVPAAVHGLWDAAGYNEQGELKSVDDALSSYVKTFNETHEEFTYRPRSVKGKKIEAGLGAAYNKWIEEKWGDHVGELVDNDYVTPEVGAWMRTSPDALLMARL